MSDGRIPLCRLYERTSARGTRYLIGRLGYARLLAFPGEPTEASTPTWDVFLVEAPPYSARQEAGGVGQVEEQAEQASAGGRQLRQPAERRPAVRRPREAPANTGADEGFDWERGDDVPF
ncbi:MAG TPA: hypothetical protein VFG47_14930 [Geminicoccaceae bacterium]|nr:hypothetical protein [Geminicoccaceae bacterium]